MAASRTMILLDPDLSALTARGDSRPTSPAAEPNERLPSVQMLTRFLKTAQTAVRLRGAVSVLLSTDSAIRRLNRTFRGKNKATDVLSFPAAERSRGEVAGDLAISVETARKQAREHGHSLAIEIKVLMLHGLLHLAGYDHETDEGQMARREQTLRAKLALPLGLIERSTAPTHSPKSRRMDGVPEPVKSGIRRKATTDPSTPPVKRRPASLRMASISESGRKSESGRESKRKSAAKRSRKP